MQQSPPRARTLSWSKNIYLHEIAIVHAFSAQGCGIPREGSYIYGVRLRWQPSVIKNPIKMKRKKWNADLVVDMVKYELNKMGLGHFETKHLLDGEDGNIPHIMVTIDPDDRQFGYVIEALDRFFSIDMFVGRFKARQNYYKLPQHVKDELFAQRIHPEAWEQDFLKANA